MQHLETFPYQFGESQTGIGTQSVPPNFYEPIIMKTLETIYTGPDCAAAPLTSDQSSSVSDYSKLPLFIQYRGKCTEDYARSLHRCDAPCTIIMTLRKR